MSFYLNINALPGALMWVTNPGLLPGDNAIFLRLAGWHFFTGGTGGDADYSALYRTALPMAERFVRPGFYVWADDAFEWILNSDGVYIAPNVLNTATYSLYLYDTNNRIIDSQTNIPISSYETKVMRGEGGLTGLWSKYHVVHRVMAPELCMFGRTAGVCNTPAPNQSAPAGTHIKLRFQKAGGGLVENDLRISCFSIGLEGEPTFCPSQFPNPSPSPTPTVDPSATATATVDPSFTSTPTPAATSTPIPGTTSTPRPQPTAWVTPWSAVVVPPPATPIPFATPQPLSFPPLLLPTLASINPAATSSPLEIGNISTPAAVNNNWTAQLGAVATRITESTELTGEFTAGINEPITQTAYIATRWAEPVDNAEAEFATQSTAVISNTNQMTGYLSWPVRAFLVVPTLLPSTWFFFAVVMAASGLVMATHIIKFLIALTVAIIGIIRAIWEAIPFN